MIRPEFVVLAFIISILGVTTPFTTTTPQSNININNDNQITSTSTTVKPLEPEIPPSDPNSPISTEAEIIKYFNATGTTCCHIQTNCKGCRNYFDVNGIRYCCPACNGQALVTNLICRCYPPSNFDTSVVKCKVNSTKVIGDYIPWRPSYYSSGGSTVKPVLWFLTFSSIGSSLIAFHAQIPKLSFSAFQ